MYDIEETVNVGKGSFLTEASRFVISRVPGTTEDKSHLGIIDSNYYP